MALSGDLQELAQKALEAFENAKLRGRFLADLEEENQRLQKELTAREAEAGRAAEGAGEEGLAEVTRATGRI